MPYYYSPFRKSYAPPSNECPFCDTALMTSQAIRNSTNTVVENEHCVWIANWFPRCDAHTMLVTKRHITKLEDETSEELVARHALILTAATALQKLYPGSGLEVFFQTGKNSLSSIPHLHWHIVPAIPEHGLTGFEKIGYFSTTKPDEEKVVMLPITITLARDELIEKLKHFIP